MGKSIGWMANNKVAANLLMFFFLIGGYFSLTHIKQEVFPLILLDAISISVVYPGASPSEIEQGILESIEAEIRGIDGVKKVYSSAREGSGRVTAELFEFIDQSATLQDVKSAVDRITTFPLEAEEPDISLQTRRRVSISLMLYGNQTQDFLRKNAEKIKNDLINVDGITLADIASPIPIEISVNVKESELRKLNLSLEDIAQKIRNYSKDIPAGGIKNVSGEILIRINERRELGKEFLDIPVLSHEGSLIRLKDIAEITDGYEDVDKESFFNGLPAKQINIYSVGKESPVEVADITRSYVENFNAQSSEALKLDIFEDRSQIYRDRINLLLKNAFMGLVLVFIILGIFLNAQLAFWVMLGLPISILGSFVFFQFTGATLNMVSLFAFIITLGIVVDDAVIVGEAVYEKRKEGVSNLQAAIFGAKEMLMPVTFAVLTNIVAFMPMLFIPGTMGDIFSQIPAVIISVLAVSLIESLFILPAHLSHANRSSKFWDIMNKPQRGFGRWLEHHTETFFKPLVRKLLINRYITLSACIALFILSIGTLTSGLIGFSFFPKIDRDTISANAKLPYGTPIEETKIQMQSLLDSANKVIEENGGQSIVRGIYAAVGEGSRGRHGSGSGPGGSHVLNVQVSLVSSDKREIGGIEFSKKWRDATIKHPKLESLTFSGQTGFGSGSHIQIEITHSNQAQLQIIAKDIANYLQTYQGIIDIDDGISLGKKQFNLKLKPEATEFNISTAEIARQIRGAFYGIEAIRQQRGENEIRVMVRLSETERENLQTLDQMMIRMPNNQFVPLNYLTYINENRAYTEIERTQGARVLQVTADVDTKKGELSDIIEDIRLEMMPYFQQSYPGLSYSLEGEESARQESLNFLKFGFLVALLGIYMLLAIAFSSYTQPIAVMLSIPFGIIGAFGGHLLLGYNISIISLIGIVGLTGIVINDSLVLIVTLNRYRKNTTIPLLESTINASARRLRPILLTTITTFMGLLPMLFETSVQARFLIPMAISISFGILFSTIIILALVPALYMIIEDFKKLFKKSTSSLHDAPESPPNQSAG